jgi:hypothetical protein
VVHWAKGTPIDLRVVAEYYSQQGGAGEAVEVIVIQDVHWSLSRRFGEVASTFPAPLLVGTTQPLHSSATESPTLVGCAIDLLGERQLRKYWFGKHQLGQTLAVVYRHRCGT